MGRRSERRQNDKITQFFGEAGGDLALSEGRDKRYSKSVQPKSENQAEYLRALGDCRITFGVGPAGTGKTFLAVATALAALRAGSVRRIILTRPAVEAGEKLGFLPGDLKDKVDPYLRPLYDALYDLSDPKTVLSLLGSDRIEIVPLAFMRGRTFRDAFIVLDEAQNCTYKQLVMAMTRIGFGARMAITGDLTPSQIDLPEGTSGLEDICSRFDSSDSRIRVCRLGSCDIVRDPLIAAILERCVPDQNSPAG